MNPVFFFSSPDPDAAGWLPDECELLLLSLVAFEDFLDPNPCFRFL